MVISAEQKMSELQDHQLEKSVGNCLRHQHSSAISSHSHTHTYTHTHTHTHKHRHTRALGHTHTRFSFPYRFRCSLVKTIQFVLSISAVPWTFCQILRMAVFRFFLGLYDFRQVLWKLISIAILLIAWKKLANNNNTIQLTPTNSFLFFS